MRTLYAVIILCLIGSVAFSQEGGRGRNKQLYAVPVSGQPVIDGKLDDWDLSGQIDIYVTQETAEMQSAKVALMYDAEAIYISGIVRDPSPMMNRHDPKVNADRAWDADAFQLRLALDPKLGYPINESSMENVKPNDQLCHLLLFNYTERNEACLQLAYGMTYSPPAAGYPQGVVPGDKFQGTYKKSDDGRGYTFEYRIPWQTLEAKNPPKAGDLCAAAIQIQWGAADGLSSTGGGWAMDLMSSPGFSFQSTACWGKVIFSEKGSLPKELVRQDLPPEKPLPLTFEYDLPKDGDVSIALVNDQGQMVHHVIAQAARKAGRVIEKWDGLDDFGKPLPAGTYSWKGIYHDKITTKYLMGVHNSGSPSYATPDGTGAWGADHGRPSTVCAAGEHMLLAWDGGEAGWSILRTDLAGKKQWGIKPGALFLASDGKARLYGSGGGGFIEGSGVSCYSLVDGRPLNFATGQPKLSAPDNGDLKAAENTVTGLALAQDGSLYVSYGKRNLVARYDLSDGKLVQKFNVPVPGAMIATSQDALAVLSEGKVLTLTKSGEVSTLIDTHLDSPISLARDSSGNLYVANRGALQNVSVFDGHGKYTRSIGKPGGRPRVGAYDKSGILEPGGIAISQDGKLWIAETLDSPKRISVWNALAGELLQEFFGAGQYATFISMDPKHEDEAYCHQTIWSIDLDKGTWYPKSTMWRATGPNTIEAALQSVRVITAANGHQFAWGIHNYGRVLYMRVGDTFKPIASGILDNKGNAYIAWPPYPIFEDAKFNSESGSYNGWFWQDSNDDQMIQETELTKSPTPGHGFGGFHWVDAELNLWDSRGYVYRPVKLEADGRPVYDFNKPEKRETNAAAPMSELWIDDSDKSIYSINNDGDAGLSHTSADGKTLWQFNVTGSWRAILNKAITKPGQVWGPTSPLGVAGDVTGVATYFGLFDLFTRDGIYLTKLFKDVRLGETGPEVINAEAFAGQLIRTEKSGRYLLLGGDTDGRITELFGLDSVKRFGGTYTLSSTDVQSVQSAQDEYARNKTRLQKLTIVRGLPAINTAPGVTRTVDADRAFTARLAYDAENLYLKWDVTSPAELVNAQADPKIIFKGGNLIDLQLATDASADPARKTPLNGDIRVLISRRADGKPIAVIYRPHVKGSQSEPIVLNSPTGKESFDSIETLDETSGLKMDYQKIGGGFVATVTLPLRKLPCLPVAQSTLKCDVGYLFGNVGGTACGQRAYLFNNSPTSGIIGDIPNESRLEPSEWGTVSVE